MTNEPFRYSYSAPTQSERKEIESLQKKYLPKQEPEGIEKLRKLDKKVHTFPTALALTLGVIGTLIFGIGLTFILEWDSLLLGVFISLIGFLPIGFAYPAYRKILQKRKEKYSEEILALSEQLLNEKTQAE